jgi:ABC-2 type transport system permease protein
VVSQATAGRLAAAESVRTCWSTAVLSFRALFNWLAPRQFLLVVLVTPVVELAFYVFLGGHLGVSDRVFFLLGGSLLAACQPSVGGGVMALTSERYYGTLEQLCAGLRRPSYLLLMRAVPYTLTGVVAAMVTLAAGAVILDIPVPVHGIVLAVPVIAAGGLSATYLGMTLGVLGLAIRQVFTLMSIATMAIALSAGLVVPLATLPGWLSTVARLLPLRHAGVAVRALVSTGRASALWYGIGAELAVAGCWAVVMLVSFTTLVRRLRRAG